MTSRVDLEILAENTFMGDPQGSFHVKRIFDVIWPVIYEDQLELARHHRDFELLRTTLDHYEIELQNSHNPAVFELIKNLRNIVG